MSEQVQEEPGCAGLPYKFDIQSHQDDRGELSFLETPIMPFRPRRIYYFYRHKTPDLVRGEHGHKELRQVIIAMAGEFDVYVRHGGTDYRFHLDHPAQGLYIPARSWRSLSRFSPGSVGVVLASEVYMPSDYIYGFDEFLEYEKQSCEP